MPPSRNLKIPRRQDFYQKRADIFDQREKAEVLAAFAAHKDEVTAGYVAVAKPG